MTEVMPETLSYSEIINQKQVTEAVIAKLLKELQEQTGANCLKPKQEIDADKEITAFLTDIIPFFDKLEPHERLRVISILKARVKCKIEERAVELDKELAYLKDVNNSL